MTVDDRESVTVACISVIGGSALLNCLRSLLRCGFDCVVIADLETVAPEISELVSRQALELIAAEGRSVPEKRALALRHSNSDWVALIEDTCSVGEEWCLACRELLALETVTAVSGPVRMGGSISVPARALYCSDYGRFFPPVLSRPAHTAFAGMLPVETLPGVNLLYRRDTVIRYLDENGLIESEVNRRMREDGHILYLHEKLSVTLEYADEKGAGFRSRFTHGRLYGGLQARTMSAPRRVLRALVCVLLPLVLSCRSLRALARIPQRTVMTALYIIAFETTWSCGECAGYLLGCGRSLEDWT